MAESQRKRSRDDEEEAAMASKRFHGLTPQAEEILQLLEDEECGERNLEDFVAAEEVVCGVMRSLEQEITSNSQSNSCSASVEVESSVSVENFTGEEGGKDEMRYLLEASDDELGIPPSPSLLEEDYSAANGIDFTENRCFKDVCLEGLWHFEDEVANNYHNYNWFESEYVYDENQFQCARDFASTYALVELSEADHSLGWTQG